MVSEVRVMARNESTNTQKRVTDARGEQLGRTMKTADYPSTLCVQQGPKDMANASRWSRKTGSHDAVFGKIFRSF